MVLNWLLSTLRSNPELALFLALAFGFWLGPRKIYGFSLGTVTATLLVALLIGQLGLEISGPIKSAFFLLFLFAVGYGVGPQFFAGLSKEGPKQIIFAAVVCVICLASAVICAKLGGFELGYGTGLYSGSQTISASIGVASGQIERLGLDAKSTKAILDQIPVGYAVTYIYGTIGSAIVLAQLGPKLLRVDLPAECAAYERQLGKVAGRDPGVISAHTNVVVRAFRIDERSDLIGKPVRELFPGLRVFVERIRRGDRLFDADPETALQAGDVAVFSGPRQAIVDQVCSKIPEVEDRDLLDIPVEQVDIFVRNKGINNKTIAQLAEEPWARGIYLRKIMRNQVEIPVFPEVEILRGDILTIAGSTKHTSEAAKALGYAVRPTEATDLGVVAAGIVVGGLIGVLTITVGKIPISLSSAGGVLLAGLLLGYLSAIHPIVGRVPPPALWLMNTLGLNAFIAIVGINAGPGFVSGLRDVGASIFLWGVVATTVPLIAALYLGRYVFKFHPAILFGACAGARTTTAAIGMIQDSARSNVPALGYGMPYAVGAPLLTIFGMVVVMLLG
jgi:putative transport protein